jgi:hypothetical protein
MNNQSSANLSPQIPINREEINSLKEATREENKVISDAEAAFWIRLADELLKYLPGLVEKGGDCTMDAN